MHANEVAILPYYVANLNIEATYAAITGDYLEYPNLCFVDTLDNVAGLRTHGVGKGQHFGDLLGAIAEENVARIKRQNARKISVIIGTPPYNANQLNESENNKNREYSAIDRRIKETYIKASTAQKTKLYDMYARFFRWASDRIEENGVIAFVSNRSFIDSRTFDGFRKIIANEFAEIYVVDLGGDVRADPRLSGTKHNVFGIQTGVAISFLIRKSKTEGFSIKYTRRPQRDTAEEKLQYLSTKNLESIEFESIRPHTNGTWINQTSNDFDELLPIADKATKSSTVVSQERSLFKLFTLGVVTNRDDWVYDDAPACLEAKVKELLQVYDSNRSGLRGKISKGNVADLVSGGAKWTRALKNSLIADKPIKFSRRQVYRSLYRPFVKKYLYYGPDLNEMVYQTPTAWPAASSVNPTICFPVGGRLSFSVFATDLIPALTVLSLDANQCLPRWSQKGGERRVDNITDWALEQFRNQYETRPSSPKGASGKTRTIDKDAIFHYVYGVLHDPVYREKYALNLKREFPRIPFYADFWAWAGWGEKLMALHIGYETVEPWKLKRVDTVDKTAKKSGVAPRAMLKALKETGAIQLDSDTQLTGVPQEAWDYRLGNRSALEWILDQYKEKTPKDPTIREKFNTYRFADYKDHVIDLLKRVTRVSVETQAIIEQMKAVPDSGR